ncbi:hypothetical protein K1T71_005336 [Dendrolimus kikuchii]|uniref:Uncharacterized protein n=1 Tax=Dendrolimus kikuchii TaxID=765133 RepID=A0ACC1D6T8_9NEOP|nr:hypothetical protein K1T71_005336 [Dendrolimus kikuchii]
MKTAATVLQEMMIKMATIPEYECIAQSGPQHQSTFDYRCTACGETVIASAHSKKEAKQEAAKLMLWTLAKKGYSVPPPYGSGAAPSTSTAKSIVSGPEAGVPKLDIRSYVALLKEFCEEYKLPASDYDVVSTTGPPHLRQFTVEARVGRHARRAVAATKKAARQVAAEQLYSYLKENLAKHTKDFQEDEALLRAHEKAMERYSAPQEAPQREDLGQKISEYHLGLCRTIDEERRVEAVSALASRRTGDEEAEEALAAVVATLGLSARFSQLGALHVVELTPAAPDLAFAAPRRPQAARQALDYLELALET